ncbi:hypothetical protein AAVH_19875 [Aphelenchoides avenae]|nr:hypothetical protein AAVH_19875 [Aphelenchus avenae]
MKDYGAIEILFHPAEFQRLYNCSAYSIDDIPLEARQHPITGAVYVILFLIYQVSQREAAQLCGKHRA